MLKIKKNIKYDVGKGFVSTRKDINPSPAAAKTTVVNLEMPVKNIEKDLICLFNLFFMTPNVKICHVYCLIH